MSPSGYKHTQGGTDECKQLQMSAGGTDKHKWLQMSVGGYRQVRLGMGNPWVSCISEQIILQPFFVRSKQALGHAKWTSIDQVMVKKNPEKISPKCGL